MICLSGQRRKYFWRVTSNDVSQLMRKTTAAKSSVTAAHLRKQLACKIRKKTTKKSTSPTTENTSTPVSQNRLNPTLRHRLTIMQKGSMLACVEDINTTTRKTTCYLIYMGRLSGCEACTPWKANMLINLVALKKGHEKTDRYKYTSVLQET